MKRGNILKTTVIKKNNILLIIFLFLITGCQANYDLKISRYNLEETTVIYENDVNRYFEYVAGVGPTYDYYMRINIPLDFEKMPKNPVVNGFTVIHDDGSNIDKREIYTQENFFDDKLISFKLVGNFYNIPIEKSSVLNNTCNIDVVQNGDKLIYSVSNFSIVFDKYDMLEKVTVNIISEYKIENSNADKVKDNVYTWIIDRGNYDQKTIDFTVTKDSFISEKKVSSESYGFGLIIIVVALIGFVLYFIIKWRFKKSNVL